MIKRTRRNDCYVAMKDDKDDTTCGSYGLEEAKGMAEDVDPEYYLALIVDDGNPDDIVWVIQIH